MKHIKSFIIIALLLLLGFGNFESDAQQRVAKNEIRAKKVAKRNNTIRKHHRAAHYRYRTLPKWGVRCTAPVAGKVIVHRNVRYRYNKGVFYRPTNNTYVIVSAPRGMRINALPAGYKKIYITGHKQPYFYYYGSYYKTVALQKTIQYEAVTAPIGARVHALPIGYSELEKNGRVYYELDNNYYKEVITGNGDDDVYYELVSSDAIG